MFKSLSSVFCVYGLLLSQGVAKLGKGVHACVLGGFSQLNRLKGSASPCCMCPFFCPCFFALLSPVDHLTHLFVGVVIASRCQKHCGHCVRWAKVMT